MQEMLLMGAGVHTKIFKSGPTSIKIVTQDRMSDIQSVVDFLEKEQSNYVKSVEIINQGY